MKIVLPLIAALFLIAGPAQSSEMNKPEAAPATGKILSSSQQRMTDCNKEAGNRKGTERRDFMRECMHGGKPGTTPATPADPANMTPQARMGHCSKLANDKQLRGGPELRAFMSECLKKK